MYYAQPLCFYSGEIPSGVLIAELRQVGLVTIEKWAYRSRLIKLVAIPHQIAGSLPIHHLMSVIHLTRHSHTLIKSLHRCLVVL